MKSQLYLLLFVLCSISLRGYGAVKPNVILIITDDQGYGDIGAHGNSMIKTPNLDRLHAQSLRLTDFHVEPCCSPTRAALMTGRTPLHNGAWATSWGRSIPHKQHLMMPAVFADNGYRTGFMGKWHLGDSYPFRPQDRGFQEVLMHGGGGVGQTPDYWGNDYFDDTYFRNGVPEQHRGYCTDVWFREAATFIASNRQQPFFVYLSTNAPHGPLIVAEKYSAPYIKKGVPAAMAKFYGMIENIDENLGRLLQNLDDWELANNTIVIFMTDNGTANGVSKTGKWRGFNAGMTGKRSAYHDGGHRVPFFLRWPAGDMQGGRDIDTLAAHVDVMPTLIDICGLEQSAATFDGKSLLPLLVGNSAVWPDRTLFVQYRRSADPPLKWEAAVLTQRWRMLNGSQLYDIRIPWAENQHSRPASRGNQTTAQPIRVLVGQASTDTCRASTIHSRFPAREPSSSQCLRLAQLNPVESRAYPARHKDQWPLDCRRCHGWHLSNRATPLATRSQRPNCRYHDQGQHRPWRQQPSNTGDQGSPYDRRCRPDPSH